MYDCVVLLVIFGAGASYDSVPHRPPPAPSGGSQSNFSSPSPSAWPPHEQFRPPLANQLFGDRELFVTAMTRFPDCLALVPFLRKADISVEKELAKFQNQAKAFPLAHRELAAIQYYLHVAISECQSHWRGCNQGITNYATLIREIERWRFPKGEQVCFVTFNYDTMLEEAATQVLELCFDDVDKYIADKQYTLIKPHGSVNWGREVDGIRTPMHNPALPLGMSDSYKVLIYNVADLSITDQFRVVNQCPMLRYEDHAVFPALAIPVENKDEFSCPQGHVDKLKQLLPMTTKMITVGWRATETDFLALLGKRIPSQIDVMIISGDPRGAAETLSNLNRHVQLQYSDYVPIESGFSALIERPEKLETFLRS